MRRSVLASKAAQALSSSTLRNLSNAPRSLSEVASAESSLPAAPASQYDKPPFRFETGFALFAKRPPRPFPPPFLSLPSTSFSDPLSTHHRSRDSRKRAFVNGERIRGYTNGDDAVYVSDSFIGANDGVGAWSTRAGGHAGFASLDPALRLR